MSEKYYREINTNKDIVKFKLQLGSILLKLNEHNLNISNIKDNITKINSDNESINDSITKLNSDIKNNDSNIKSNYDLCVTCKNDLISIDRKIYAINNNITNINTDIKNNDSNITKIITDIKNIGENNTKHNYAIENIWLSNIDILNTYTITSSKVSLFEYNIEGKFITNSILEISCNILYKYANYNDVGLLKHIYSLLDANDNLIYTNSIIHTNSGDNYTNHLTMNDSLLFCLKIVIPPK